MSRTSLQILRAVVRASTCRITDPMIPAIVIDDCVGVPFSEKMKSNVKVFHQRHLVKADIESAHEFRIDSIDRMLPRGVHDLLGDTVVPCSWGESYMGISVEQILEKIVQTLKVFYRGLTKMPVVVADAGAEV